MQEVTAKFLREGLLEKALTSAASLGDVESCKEAIRRGADVNWWREREVPALHWAAQCGYVEIARMLIAAGADVNLAEGGGARALTWAVTCRAGEEIVKVLLEAGADPNYGTKSWSTPLCSALATNELGVMRLLLEHGARVAYVADDAPVNTTNALQQAVIWSKVDAVRLLGAASSEALDEVTHDGHTLLDLAKGSLEMTSVIHSLQTDAAVRKAMAGASELGAPRALSSISRGPI
jgi:ankyrin repeat protein